MTNMSVRKRSSCKLGGLGEKLDEMEEAAELIGGSCSHCRYGGISAYCPSCGRQLMPQPKGRLVCRAMKGSAAVAWKALGFADAESAVQRQRNRRGENEGMYLDGSTRGLPAPESKDGSVNCIATQGLAATRSAIERDFASPTEEQARIMGVESVVEGVQWDLSTKQLQVMALARSGALRSRGRNRSSSLRQRTRGVPTRTSSLVKQHTSSRLVQKSGTRPRPAARGGRCRCKHKHEDTFIGDLSASQKRHSGDTRHRSTDNYTRLLRRGYVASGFQGGGGLPEERETSDPSASWDKHGAQDQGQTTQEQAMALSKGGVRRGRVVFHRKGVKLSEESPRSMPPRKAFQAPGSYVLCTKRWTMVCRDGRQWLLSAALLAIVAVAEATTNTTATRVCIGVRLDVLEMEHIRHLPTETPSVEVDKKVRLMSPTAIASATKADLSNGFSGGGGQARNLGDDFTITRVVLTENQPEFPVEISRNDTIGYGSSEAWGAGSPPPTALEKQTRKKANAEREAVQKSDPTGEPNLESGISRAVSGDGVDAAGIDQRLLYQVDRVVLREDLTHAEVGALVGPELCWRNPLEENITIRDLNASWMACLGSLCGRMRDSSVSTEAEVGETRHQLRADQQPAPFDSDPQRHAAESPTSAGSNHHNQGTPSDQSEPDVNPNDHCPSPTAAGTASVEDVTVPFRSARTALGRGAGVLAQESNFSCRAQIEAPATVPIQDVRENAAEVARLSLDRTLVRVGARVPWGPRHRGRFAKVLFTVRLGRGCRGLEFVGVSASSTGDKGVQGCWKCVATDQELARILRPDVWGLADSRLRARSYNPERCTAELQLAGELTWACTLLARKAFRLVLSVPGGATLLLAGVTQPAGREISWPQDIKDDSKRTTASINIQMAWRGCAGRKYAQWVRMDREGRRRLARLRAEAQAEQERVRALVETEKALNEDRQSRAQTKLAAAARGRAARRQASERRARAEIEVKRNKIGENADAAFENSSTEQQAAPPSTPGPPATVSTGSVLSAQHDVPMESKSDSILSYDKGAQEGASITTAPGATRLERVLAIDGTQISLTAYVKEPEERGSTGSPLEMDVKAVDVKTRRSSCLVLKPDDFAAIERSATAAAEGHAGVEDDGCAPGAADGLTVAGRARIAFARVVKSLTVFNSRQKDLFILSYKGRKVAAQH